MASQVHGRKKPARRVLRTSGVSPQLHCMAIPTDKETLLLPTTVMEEVIDYQPPAPIECAPPWLLGNIDWDNRQVPVFSFTALINGSDVGPVPPRSKVVILKSLGSSGRVPYLGLLLGGLPHPVTVKYEDLLETGDDKKSLGVFRRVLIEEEEAIIPDLDRLTHLVTHAAFGALPITRLDRDDD
ncbi:MAG TPA: chemotaxis protein CheW [Xanthomonadales bacterium]|nr:chemotaxis protein CheW [Xanthomonadales bacterium]